MDRRPEHLLEDPVLRGAFIDQISWDEWAIENAPFLLVPDAREMVTREMARIGMEATYEDALFVATEQWQSTLDPETNMAEVLYLAGNSYLDRQRITDQRHAELLRICVEKGFIPEREQDIEFREQFGS